mgnify:CR=1 FL=1
MKKIAKGICKVCIVKRKGHIEEFDDRKIYRSAYFACRNAHLSEKQSKAIAKKVGYLVFNWAFAILMPLLIGLVIAVQVYNLRENRTCPASGTEYEEYIKMMSGSAQGTMHGHN